MPKGKPVTAKDLNTFLERIAAGDTLTVAAETAGQDSPAPFYRRKDPRSPIYDPVFAQAFNEAVEEFLQRKRDLVDQTVEKRAKDPDAPPPIVSMWAKRWHPAYRDRQHIEETTGGDDDRDDQIAEAIERFTAAVVQLASRERAELPAGETS